MRAIQCNWIVSSILILLRESRGDSTERSFRSMEHLSISLTFNRIDTSVCTFAMLIIQSSVSSIKAFEWRSKVCLVIEEEEGKESSLQVLLTSSKTNKSVLFMLVNRSRSSARSLPRFPYRLIDMTMNLTTVYFSSLVGYLLVSRWSRKANIR